MKYFLNCHVKGVHSLSIGETHDGNLIRMFIAEENHELWKNTGENFEKGIQSLAFHGHNKDITLIPLTGLFWNLKLGGKRGNDKMYDFKSFEYISEIENSGKGKFVNKEVLLSARVDMDIVTQPLILKTYQLHSVYVPKGKSASWMVIESGERRKDTNLSYSVRELDLWSTEGLYLVPTETQRDTLINKYLLGRRITSQI